MGMKDKATTPLGFLPASPAFEGVGLEGFSLANLRERHHLAALVEAVGSGKIPVDTPCPYGLPTIATALQGWSRWIASERKNDERKKAGEGLARFHYRQAWDGSGRFEFPEILVAALFRAGAPLFPEGTEEEQFKNLETAIHEGALATATSLILSPQCPDLTSSPHASLLLSQALRMEQSEVVEALLDKGVNPNQRVTHYLCKGWPAWFFAKNPTHLEWLLEAGADPMACTRDGKVAQEVWSKSSGILSSHFRKMAKTLSQRSPSQNTPSESLDSSSELLGAFAAAELLRIGALRDWIRQDPTVVLGRQPVPGAEGEEETLAQKVVRTYVFQKTFNLNARGWGNASPAALGVLKLFLEHQGVGKNDKELVALVSLAMGSALGVEKSEMSARKVWQSMKEGVREVLASDEARESAWRGLGDVFRRVCLGATFSGSPSSSAAFRISPLQPDDPGRGDEVVKKMREVLGALTQVPAGVGQNGNIADPVLVAKMFAAWAPGFRGKRFRELGSHVARFLNPQLPPTEERSNLIRHMSADPEVSLGTLVSLILSGDTSDAGGWLTSAVQQWEKSLPVLFGSELADDARKILKPSGGGGGLHPELARIGAEWEGRIMDQNIPEPSKHSSLSPTRRRF